MEDKTLKSNQEKQEDTSDDLSLAATTSKLDLDRGNCEEKEEQPKIILPRKLLILYAGETGNSEDVARRAGWEARRRHIVVQVKQFDDYQIGQLVKEKLVLMICATTNQGDEPPAINKFWSFIMRRGLPSNALAQVRFAIIGLGDSSYLKYNVVGKKLFKRMQQLGAVKLLDLCLGDDQHDLGLGAAVDPWLEMFWQNVENLLIPSEKPFIALNELPLPSYEFKVMNAPETLLKSDVNELKNEYTARSPYLAKVLTNERVTPKDHFQETRFMSLELDQQKIHYEPGDVAMILPENSPDKVAELLKVFEITGDENFIVKRTNKDFLGECLYDYLAEKVISIRQLLQKFCNFNVIPKRCFFELMWRFAEDTLEHDKLKEYASTNGQQELYLYCIHPKRTIFEVLIDFPKTASKIPTQYLTDLFPAIVAKPYSIASSQKTHVNELHLLYAVVQYKTLLRQPRLGFCTNYMKKQDEGTHLRVYIRKGTFKWPSDQTPVVMICTGTGIAPFRSIIQDRVYNNCGSNFLFFGCRNKDKDFYFGDEWVETNARGLLYYYVAFSRENEKKLYVQNRLWTERFLLWDLISRCDAHLYIAGSAGEMPKQVRATLIKIFQSEGVDLKEDQAELIIDKFEQKGRIQYECWT